MTDPRVTLKNQWLAGGLAYLIPGAGHWYQGRHFKGTIYFICIMGIMIWGSSMGEAKAIHLRWDTEKANHGGEKQRTLGFLAQAGVGVVALPSLVQFSRDREQFERPTVEPAPGSILEDIDAPFVGRLEHHELGNGPVTGRVTGKVVVGKWGSSSEFEGRFVGQLNDTQNVDLQLFGSKNASSLDLGPRVTGLDQVSGRQGQPAGEFSGSRRRFYTHVMAGVQNMGLLEGTIPRSIFNHAFAPLSDDAMKHLHGRLGKTYELALVYTWIAGLLNVLAIWDAMYGPAYGYGDEVDTPAPSSPDEATVAQAAAATTEAVAVADKLEVKVPS